MTRGPSREPLSDPIDLIVNPCPLDHADADVLAGPRLLHRVMIDLDRVDLLDEVGGVAQDVDGVADARLSASITPATPTWS